MATQVPITIRDADDNDIDTSATQLDNGHRRSTLAIGGSDNVADIVPANATQGLWVRLTNPGDIAGGGGGSVTPETRSDTFTGTGNGTAINASTKNCKYFGMRVKGTGAAPTAWTVNFQVSFDGTNYTTLFVHSNTTDADGGFLWPSTPAVALYFRSNVSALTLSPATNLIVTIVGMV
jgi:hypothetical protein